MMLRMAGTLADGTITYWANERAIADHVVPTIAGAAATAGRPAPRVVAGIPVARRERCRARPRSARPSCSPATTASRRTSGSAARAVTPSCPTSRSSATRRPCDARLRAYADAGATDVAAAVIGLDDDREASMRPHAASARRADSGAGAMTYDPRLGPVPPPRAGRAARLQHRDDRRRRQHRHSGGLPPFMSNSQGRVHGGLVGSIIDDIAAIALRASDPTIATLLRRWPCTSTTCARWPSARTTSAPARCCGSAAGWPWPTPASSNAEGELCVRGQRDVCDHPLRPDLHRAPASHILHMMTAEDCSRESSSGRRRDADGCAAQARHSRKRATPSMFRRRPGRALPGHPDRLRRHRAGRDAARCSTASRCAVSCARDSAGRRS